MGKPKIRKKCRFCEHRALSFCDWPTVRPVRFEPYDAVGVDDVLVQATGWRAQIREVRESVGYIALRISVFDLGKDRARRSRVRRRLPWEMLFYLGPDNFRKFRVERMSTCDAPCCFRHRRHIGPDKDYCQDHWKSWEAVS